MGICCTIQGHNTQIHPQTQRNRTHVHIMFKTALRYALKNSSDTLFTSPDNIRHQQTPANAIPCQHDPWTAFLGVWGSLLVSFGVCWSLMVSVVVLISSEIPGGGVWEHIDEEYVCLWGLDVSMGVYECDLRFSPPQSKALFTSEFIRLVRVLSIQENPYQALVAVY